jgi:trehalose 6-phosphate phosphatase
MSPKAATPANGGWALFLDVDGTLVEIAQTPHDVQVPDSVKNLLSTLCVRLDGALALVSGRTIADLDALFAPHRFCAAGVHGCELRDASGWCVRPRLNTRSLQLARSILAQLTVRYPALLLEDKGLGLALHFRRAPQLRTVAHTAMKSVAEVLGQGFTLIAGKLVYEIHPAGLTKATAIASFMEQAPFRGRTPIFIGDDSTDENAFTYVNGARGISLHVGENSPTSARHSVSNVADVIRWLKAIPLVLGRCLP